MHRNKVVFYILIFIDVFIYYYHILSISGGFPGSTMVHNPPASVGNARDVGLIPGSGRSPGVGNGSILAWKIPWMEEPCGLQFMGLQRDMTE